MKNRRGRRREVCWNQLCPNWRPPYVLPPGEEEDGSDPGANQYGAQCEEEWAECLDDINDCPMSHIDTRELAEFRADIARHKAQVLREDIRTFETAIRGYPRTCDPAHVEHQKKWLQKMKKELQKMKKEL